MVEGRSEEASVMDMSHLIDVTILGPNESLLKEPTDVPKSNAHKTWKCLKSTCILFSRIQKLDKNITLTQKKKREVEDLILR